MYATLVIMFDVVIVVLLGMCSGYDYPSCASCHAGMLEKKKQCLLTSKSSSFFTFPAATPGGDFEVRV